MSPLLLALALAASTSKLGVVVVGDIGLPTSPASQIMAACPVLAVFPISPDGSNTTVVALQLTAYKSACPATRAIVQVGGSGLAVDATVAATNWNSVWLLQVIQLNSSLISGIEGPWEPTGTAANISAFWGEFARDVSGSGFVPIVGALASGLPVGLGTPADAFCATATAVRTAGVQNFGWSVHVRSGAMATTDQAFAFRQIVSDCSLGSVPLYITAALPGGLSWSQSDMAWLAWFDGQLASSTAVGIAAVAIGANAASLDLSPIATQFIAQLTNPAGGDGGDGTGGGGSGGVVPDQPRGGTGELSSAKTGCATGAPGLLALLVLPLLVVRRALRLRLRA